MSYPGIYDAEAHSSTTFDMQYRSRSVQPPAKRVVKKSIPYHNGTIDFSNLYGEPYYEERSVEYVFEAVDESAEAVQASVDAFSNWLISLTDTDIYDDEMSFWHWHGGCDSVSVEYEDDGLKAIVTAAFSVYPFRIANSQTCRRLVVGSNKVINDSRPARLYVIPDGSQCTITINAVRQTFIGETLSDLTIPHGTSTITVSSGSCTIKWREERI